MAIYSFIAVGLLAALTGGTVLFQRVVAVPGRGVHGGRRRAPSPHGATGRPVPLRSRQRRPPKVSVVIPTLNEAGCLSWVLERIPPSVDEIVLVDGLSTDETEVIARDILADVIVVHQMRRGKGAALRAGFAAATGDIIVMLDADGSTPPAEIDAFIAALEEGAEFVKGSRYMRGGGSDDLTLLRRAGNLFFVVLVNVLYGRRFTDLCYGFCGFWRSALDRLPLCSDGFEIETELVLCAVNAGLEMREVPSHEMCRRAGASNLNAWRDGLRVLRQVFAERPRSRARRPDRAAPVHLVPVEVAHPSDEKWVPAGKDRRRAIAPDPSDAERQPGEPIVERRTPPEHTVTVYRVLDEPATTLPVRERIAA